MDNVFETKLGRFYLGDARKLIKEIPSNSVDAIVTDPPWGVGFDEYDNFDVFIEIAEDVVFRYFARYLYNENKNITHFTLYKVM